MTRFEPFNTSTGVPSVTPARVAIALVSASAFAGVPINDVSAANAEPYAVHNLDVGIRFGNVLQAATYQAASVGDEMSTSLLFNKMDVRIGELTMAHYETLRQNTLIAAKVDALAASFANMQLSASGEENPNIDGPLSILARFTQLPDSKESQAEMSDALRMIADMGYDSGLAIEWAKSGINSPYNPLKIASARILVFSNTAENIALVQDTLDREPNDFVRKMILAAFQAIDL